MSARVRITAPKVCAFDLQGSSVRYQSLCFYKQQSLRLPNLPRSASNAEAYTAGVEFHGPQALNRHLREVRGPQAVPHHQSYLPSRDWLVPVGGSKQLSCPG